MKYKLLMFLLMLTSNCLALVFQPDTIAISNGMSHNTLDEYGYDMTADTVANYLNKPIQHLMTFQNDTIQLRISASKHYKGYYQWRGFTISNFYVKCSEATFRGMYAVILSPVTMIAGADSNTDSVYTDRLLIIEYKGKRWVYANVIRNTECEDSFGFEDLRAGEEGLELSYMAGQGYKYYYNILIAMSFGQPCLMNLDVEEHNSTAQYQATHQYDFTASDEADCYPLYSYRRHFPMLLRGGNYDSFVR